MLFVVPCLFGHVKHKVTFLVLVYSLLCDLRKSGSAKLRAPLISRKTPSALVRRWPNWLPSGFVNIAHTRTGRPPSSAPCAALRGPAGVPSLLRSPSRAVLLLMPVCTSGTPQALATAHPYSFAQTPVRDPGSVLLMYLRLVANGHATCAPTLTGLGLFVALSVCARGNSLNNNSSSSSMGNTQPIQDITLSSHTAPQNHPRPQVLDAALLPQPPLQTPVRNIMTVTGSTLMQSIGPALPALMKTGSRHSSVWFVITPGQIVF